MIPEIQPAKLSDVDELVHLINSAYRGSDSHAGWTTEAGFLDGQRTDAALLLQVLKRPDSVILTLRESGRREILSCVHVEKSGDDCALGMLTVNPRLQAAGLGRQLLDYAEDFARRQWRARRVVLSVIQVRDTLIAWYERRGYRKTGETKPFPYGDERCGVPLRPDLHFVVFEKQLG